MRVAVGLRLGTAVCGPHSCHLCGTAVDSWEDMHSAVGEAKEDIKGTQH